MLLYIQLFKENAIFTIHFFLIKRINVKSKYNIYTMFKLYALTTKEFVVI